jgi:class 3 adenylate cyclase
VRARPNSTFEDQQQVTADLRRQLAERTAERDAALADRDEALEQQTATAEVLGVINSSPGDLAPVFDAMLERAMRLCEAAFGHLDTYDGNSFHTAAIRGVPAAYAEYRRNNPPIYGPGTGPARMLAGERIVHHLDMMEEEAYRRGEPNRRALVDLGGARSAINMALVKDGTFLGFITLFRREVRPFTDKQIALVENFAAQAVIAIENARLINETREALDQQTATAEVLRVINSSPGDLAPVFDVLLERATRLCEASFGYLLTYDGERLHPAADRGHPSFAAWIRANIQAQNPHKPEPGTSNARLLAGEDVVHIPDVTDDAGVSENSLVRRALIEIGGFRTILSIALRRERSLLGIIHIYRQEVRPFSDKQIALLQNFASQAVIAIENARLLGELRQRTEEVGELNRDLEVRVAAQVDELGRVGRLKRFLAPQLAELIVSQGDENILESHRREIVVVFCDLRGYTAFTETAEPEEVLDFLREYHGALGPLVAQFEGTLDQFSGDGIMVFFNDPVPCPDPAERAVKMAVAMREVAGTLIGNWRRRGRELGFGAGIAQGYATLGQIGFAERSGYTAIGTVCNLAARLCAEATDGQILVAQRVAVAVEGTTTLEEIGALTLKGLTQPVVAFNVPLAATQPALRVIEGGGPQSV